MRIQLLSSYERPLLTPSTSVYSKCQSGKGTNGRMGHTVNDKARNVHRQVPQIGSMSGPGVASARRLAHTNKVE